MKRPDVLGLKARRRANAYHQGLALIADATHHRPLHLVDAPPGPAPERRRPHSWGLISTTAALIALIALAAIAVWLAPRGNGTPVTPAQATPNIDPTLDADPTSTAAPAQPTTRQHQAPAPPTRQPRQTAPTTTSPPAQTSTAPVRTTVASSTTTSAATPPPSRNELAQDADTPDPPTDQQATFSTTSRTRPDRHRDAEWRREQ